MTAVKLNLLVLKTHQVAQLREFYSALGISFNQEKHGNGPTHLGASVGGVVLELYPLSAETDNADATTRLGFAVEDLDAVLRSLEVTGAIPVSGPQSTPWGRRAVVRDADGRTVELVQQ